VNLQHVNIKFIVQNPDGVHLERLIPIFHRWIEGQIFEELLLDVADYQHVHEGPGVVLIGYQADYSVDNTDGRLGVRYNRKAITEGSNQDRLMQATRAALTACQRLEAEPNLDGKLRINGRDLEIFVNDRLDAPNTDASRQAVQRELAAFLAKLFRGSEYSLLHNGDPRRLFGLSVKAARPFALSELIANLSATV
jgi:hypothetical protein